ncbi:SDR family oxidoreductase [Candidatus Poribacteria bacterium]|nr:SDR family oxidoreductase [Candidatus Poribacteria bacterium]
MVLVVGATGILGSEICRRLAAEGKPVGALVRATSDPSKVDTLKRYGVTLVQGDLKERPPLDAACQGVTTVISTASSTLSRQAGDSIETVDVKGQMSLIDAAQSAGVKHFVFISFRHDIPHLQCPLSIAKRTVEQHLKASGLTYTILWGNFFMEVWLSPALGFDFPNAKATIYGSGRNKVSWVSFKDIAQFAVASLDNPAARNVTLEVGGPEALSPLEVVEIFEAIGGRKFTVELVPDEALQAQRTSATDPLLESFATLMLMYARGDTMDMQETLKTFPVKLTAVRDYAKSMLATS